MSVGAHADEEATHRGIRPRRPVDAVASGHRGNEWAQLMEVAQDSPLAKAALVGRVVAITSECGASRPIEREPARPRNGADVAKVLGCLTGLLEQIPGRPRRALTRDERWRGTRSWRRTLVPISSSPSTTRGIGPRRLKGLLHRYLGRQQTSPSIASQNSMPPVTASTGCSGGSITDA